jgi:hypothetical protein
MAATKTRPRTNGAVDKAKHAGDAVAGSARRAAGPAIAAGAAAAGLAGGMLIGSRLVRRRPSAPALALAGAKRFAAAAAKASRTADDIHQVRVQLENANRRSPVEVVLDGLTHRPGTAKRERRLA